MNEVVTILHPGVGGGVDEYGEPIPTPPTAEDVVAIGVAPGPSEESNRRQTTVEVAFTLYLPAGTNVDHKGQIIVRGNTYEVVSYPAVWESAFSNWRPGVVVDVAESS